MGDIKTTGDCIGDNRGCSDKLNSKSYASMGNALIQKFTSNEMARFTTEGASQAYVLLDVEMRQNGGFETQSDYVA